LDEHGLDDVVARIDVGQEFVEQIAAARMVPEMMVRVDDRQIRLEDLLRPLAEPSGIGQRAGIGAGFASGVGGHGILRGEVNASVLICDGVLWQNPPQNRWRRR
jgi:hypothetical protein